MRQVAWLVVLVACGGGKSARTPTSTPEDPETRALREDSERIEAMKPPSPYEDRTRRAFAPNTVCGQGPYKLAFPPVHSKYGERTIVGVCAKVAIEGDYRFTDRTADAPAHFGWGGADGEQHCVATASELMRKGEGGSGGTVAPGKPGAPAAPATIAGKPVELRETTLVATGDLWCPAGMIFTQIVNTGIESGDASYVSHRDVTALQIEIWSKLPMYLDGAVFVVRQQGVRADMTDAQWADYRARDTAYYTAYRAHLDRRVKHGSTTLLDSTAKSEAPPPPRAETPPPRPSAHAEWIAGYWQHETTWIWSPGFWRVPEADLVAEQTVQAPAPPPPMRVETPTAPPPTTTTQLVWTPGYWAWNGAAYIWIEGAYRIPPRNAQWVAPAWTARAGRVVFRPGGWSIRIR